MTHCAYCDTPTTLTTLGGQTVYDTHNAPDGDVCDYAKRTPTCAARNRRLLEIITEITGL